MAFYLKKTKVKGRTYLSIDESFYSQEKKGTAHKCYKSLGSLESWLSKGMEDPISHFQKEVDALNLKRKGSARKISDISPVFYLGYFPLKALLEKINISKKMNDLIFAEELPFNLYTFLSSLIFARAVTFGSKHKSFRETLPDLFDVIWYSDKQLIEGLKFLGCHYESIVNMFTEQLKKTFEIDESRTYFDYNNFYFAFRQPENLFLHTKEKRNKKELVVGFGLILDNDQIPIGMKMYHGDEAERLVLHETIGYLKYHNDITGRTVYVADKDLDNAKDFIFSKTNGDGYLYSKFVKQLPEEEKNWALMDDGWRDLRDKKGNFLVRCKSCIEEFSGKVGEGEKESLTTFREKRLFTFSPSLTAMKKYEINRLSEQARELVASQARPSEYGKAGKYVSFTDEEGAAVIDWKAIDNDLRFAGYNLLVTSETAMEDLEMYDTYLNLWRMEQSFKAMKSDLDTIPKFCREEKTIEGHFLICYLAILLERIFQFKILDKKYGTAEVFQFISDLKVTKADTSYINTAKANELISDLSKLSNLPLTDYFLTEEQIDTILNYKL
ncbi:MAG: IS1634 family transposase [Lachnospiraceae bacterium]|jgi:hypothetical protein